MPGPVACPSCGADGTDAANAILAQTTGVRPDAVPYPVSGSRRRWHPLALVLFGIVGLLLVAFTASVVVKLVRMRPAGGRPPDSSSRVEPSRRQSPFPGGPASTPETGQRKGSPSQGRLGSPGEAAPVPMDTTSVEIWWGNRWWPGTIVRRDGQRALVHYEGWSSASDEWVTPERLKPRTR